MAVLDVQVPSRILFGIDALNQIGDAARAIGERTILVTEVSVQDNPVIGQLKTILSRSGVNCLIFDELQSSTGNDIIQNIITMVRASKPHSVIGIGGMKALGIARTVAALAPGKMTIEAYLRGEIPTEDTLSYISVPTTCRDHFMSQNRYILTDGYRQRPVLVNSPPAMKRIVVLDPKISMSLSPKYYSVVMMDVLLSAIEAYTSSLSNFYSDILALKAIENIGTAYSELAYNPKDIRPRVKASEAGLFAALALGTSSQGIGGAISFAVNSRYNIPKSWASTALLPFLLDLHAAHQPQKVAAIARALGEDTETVGPEEGAMKASRAVRKIIAKLELPGRLRDFNISMEILPEIAEIASELEYSRLVPFALGHSKLYELVKQAF